MAKTTLKEKVIVAQNAVSLLKRYANTLRQEARCYDCSWPLGIAKDMEQWATELERKLK